MDFICDPKYRSLLEYRLLPSFLCGETLGWLECDLYCGDATFGAPGQGSGGPALSGSVLHSEPWSQLVTPSPAPLSGPSGNDVVRPNLSIGAVPRNFYGPTTGVVPGPPGNCNKRCHISI